MQGQSHSPWAAPRSALLPSLLAQHLLSTASPSGTSWQQQPGPSSQAHGCAVLSIGGVSPTLTTLAALVHICVFFSRRLRRLWSNLSRAVRLPDAATVGWPSSLQSLLPCLTCSTARKGFLLLGHQHRCPGGRGSQGSPRPGAQEPPQKGTGCPADVLPRRPGAPSPRDP